MSTPPSGNGDVRLTSDVADGATVAPGDDILLRLTWDPGRWREPQLDRALHCVRLKGVLDPNLSAEEAPTDNDGVFEYRLHVPDDIRPDCDICAEGYVAGEAAGGGGRQVRSTRHCFMSGRPVPPGPPATRPPTPPAPPVSPPPPTTAVLPRTPAEVPTDVGGVTATQPTNPAPLVPAPAAELPRTGTAASRAGTAGGGLGLALGGVALMGGARRRKHHRAGG
jgi:LPXTG-motif cell wall-anchored protein